MLLQVTSQEPKSSGHVTLVRICVYSLSAQYEICFCDIKNAIINNENFTEGMATSLL